VQAPTSNQVRGADDHGFLGEFDVDLGTVGKMETDSKMWRRRIRQMLYRPKGKAATKEVVDVFADTSAEKNANAAEEIPGMECTGILIELMVEVRLLDEAECELDKGQTLRSKESLIAATQTGGVKMIPE